MNILEQMDQKGQIRINGLPESTEPKIVAVGELICDKRESTKEVLFWLEHLVEVIDENIALTIDRLRRLPTIKLKPRVYVVCKTLNENTNDAKIIPFLNIQLFSPSEILTTACNLVVADLCAEEQNLIHDLSLAGQENLNLGYCLLPNEQGENTPHVVYLERQLNGSIYHLHSTPVPRFYKKSNRHMLTRK